MAPEIVRKIKEGRVRPMKNYDVQIKMGAIYTYMNVWALNERGAKAEARRFGQVVDVQEVK